MDIIKYILINLLDLYQFIILIACILSFVQPNPYNKLVIIINMLTQPVFNFARKLIPIKFHRIDFSPMIVIFGIYILKRILYSL